MGIFTFIINISYSLYAGGLIGVINVCPPDFRLVRQHNKTQNGIRFY